MDPCKTTPISGFTPLAERPFERAARAMCREYTMEPTAEQLARCEAFLAHQQYRDEVRPLHEMLCRIESLQPIRAVWHADGHITVERERTPQEQALETLIHERIEQARQRCQPQGI